MMMMTSTMTMNDDDKFWFGFEEISTSIELDGDPESWVEQMQKMMPPGLREMLEAVPAAGAANSRRCWKKLARGEMNRGGSGRKRAGGHPKRQSKSKRRR